MENLRDRGKKVGGGGGGGGGGMNSSNQSDKVIKGVSRRDKVS